MPRAGVYLRISEDREGTGLAVDRQRSDCLDLARRRDLTVVGEYVDNDISAAGKRKRPAFLRLIADIKAGHVDIVVAYALDRLTRTARDRLLLTDTCRAKGVSVMLVRGSDMDLTSAAGRLTMGILGEVAQHEIDAKSERHRRQQQQRVVEGKPAGGGTRAFGYQPGGLEVHPVEAVVVRQLYERFLSGATLVELALWLNGEGWPTPRGNRWRMSSVRVVLANPRNAGLRGIRRVVDEATGRRAVWHDIAGDAVWPGIVELETWQATMAILRDPQRAKFGGPRHPSSRALLSGIALCGRCGMVVVTSSGPGRRRTYRCSSKMHIVRLAEPIDLFVETALLGWLQRPDVTAEALRPDGARDEVAQLRAQAAVEQAKLRSIAERWADHVLDDFQAKVAGDRCRARLAVVEERLAALGRVDVVGPLVAASGVAAAWQVWRSYPMATRRQVVSEVAQVEVMRGRPGRPPVGVGFDESSVRITWRPATAPG